MTCSAFLPQLRGEGNRAGMLEPTYVVTRNAADGAAASEYGASASTQPDCDRALKRGVRQTRFALPGVLGECKTGLEEVRRAVEADR